jgi:hypothetical protein
MAGCCINFSEQTSGTDFNVGDVITSCDTDILVEQFQWGNGTWTSDGTARVDDRNYAKGSGNDLNARNVNLNFQYDYPLDKISFKFGDYGGNSNIKINGDFRNISDMTSLNGITVGSVQISMDVVQDGNNWIGNATLEGTINEFVIGGQELWLDDICPCN